MNILVVGGAGYIGSHCVRELQSKYGRVVVLDNLCKGHRAALNSDVVLYEVDMGDVDAVEEVLRKESIELVMHFGAYIEVGESVKDPVKYYQNNTIQSIRLFEAMRRVGVKKIIFSSTAAAYGIPESLPIREGMRKEPESPYGWSKVMVEKVLRDLSKAEGWSFSIFYYFNAAGASEAGDIGEDHFPETHLLPIVIEVALGKRKHVEIYGSDYPTPDGTCVRDYVHVEDLASAHILAIEKLKGAEGVELFYNLGTGRGYSVREVIQAVEEVSGKEILVKESARRPGDVPELYADPSLAMGDLGWKPKHQGIQSIVETAFRWHKENPEGFGD